MILKSIRDYSGIYIAIEPVDFRKAVDGLAHVVRQELELDPFGNYLFLSISIRPENPDSIAHRQIILFA